MAAEPFQSWVRRIASLTHRGSGAEAETGAAPVPQEDRPEERAVSWVGNSGVPDGKGWSAVASGGPELVVSRLGKTGLSRSSGRSWAVQRRRS